RHPGLVVAEKLDGAAFRVGFAVLVHDLAVDLIHLRLRLHGLRRATGHDDQQTHRSNNKTHVQFLVWQSCPSRSTSEGPFAGAPARTRSINRWPASRHLEDRKLVATSWC